MNPDAHPHTRDLLAEIEAEVAHELEEERPPAGGPAYQTVGALVGIAVGVGGAVLSYGYGLGSMREPGPGMWPFIVSVVIATLSVLLLVVGRGLTDSEAFTRSSVLPVVGIVTFVAFGRADAADRLRDSGAGALRDLAALPRRRELAQHRRDQRADHRGLLLPVPLRVAHPAPSPDRLLKHHGLQRISGRLRASSSNPTTCSTA